MIKKIQIVTPVYNEEKNIYTTIKNFFSEYENSDFEISFIISEDGSTDNSIKIINELQKTYEIKLISSPERKNYTDAILIGLRNTNSNIIALSYSGVGIQIFNESILIDLGFDQIYESKPYAYQWINNKKIEVKWFQRK